MIGLTHVPTPGGPAERLCNTAPQPWHPAMGVADRDAAHGDPRKIQSVKSLRTMVQYLFAAYSLGGPDVHARSSTASPISSQSSEVDVIAKDGRRRARHTVTLEKFNRSKACAQKPGVRILSATEALRALRSVRVVDIDLGNGTTKRSVTRGTQRAASVLRALAITDLDPPNPPQPGQTVM
jgi:hypothetical protein